MKLVSIIVFFTLPVCMNAQNKIIKGNGNFSSVQKSLPVFDAVYIDMFCDVYITAGSMPMAEITGDKNVIRKLSLHVQGKELRIEVKEGFWLQSTRPRIYLQTPYLTRITTKGLLTDIGDIRIQGIDVDQFEANLLYGRVQLEGVTNKLLVQSSNRNYYQNQGTLDASLLIAQEVDAHIQGSNSVKVHAIEKLTVNLMHDATLKYNHEPREIGFKGNTVKQEPGVLRVKGYAVQEDKKESELPRVVLEYVELKVKNNSMKRRHFIIKGPTGNGRGFSYGFPMMPMTTRSKKVPAGTRIFLERNVLPHKELITITAEEEGKVVDLFTH